MDCGRPGHRLTGWLPHVRDLIAVWPGAAVSASLDPGWREIRHLTG